MRVIYLVVKSILSNSRSLKCIWRIINYTFVIGGLYAEKIRWMFIGTTDISSTDATSVMQLWTDLACLFCLVDSFLMFVLIFWLPLRVLSGAVSHMMIVWMNPISACLGMIPSPRRINLEAISSVCSLVGHLGEIL